MNKALLALVLSFSLFTSCHFVKAVKMGVTLYSVLAVGAEVIAQTSLAHMTEKGIDAIIDYFNGETETQSVVSDSGGPMAKAVNLRNKNDLQASSLANFSMVVTAYLDDNSARESGVVKVNSKHVKFVRVDTFSPWDFTLDSKRLIKERKNAGIIQAAFKVLGYNEVGKIDGIIGKNTRRAIRNFQKRNRIPVTGNVDVSTLNTIHSLVNIDVSGQIQ